MPLDYIEKRGKNATMNNYWMYIAHTIFFRIKVSRFRHVSFIYDYEIKDVSEITINGIAANF